MRRSRAWARRLPLGSAKAREVVIAGSGEPVYCRAMMSHPRLSRWQLAALVLLVAPILAFGGVAGKGKPKPKKKSTVYVCSCLGVRSCACMTEAKTPGPCACGTQGGPPMKAVACDSAWAKANRDALSK